MQKDFRADTIRIMSTRRGVYTIQLRHETRQKYETIRKSTRIPYTQIADLAVDALLKSPKFKKQVEPELAGAAS